MLGHYVIGVTCCVVGGGVVESEGYFFFFSFFLFFSFQEGTMKKKIYSKKYGVSLLRFTNHKVTLLFPPSSSITFLSLSSPPSPSLHILFSFKSPLLFHFFPSFHPFPSSPLSLLPSPFSLPFSLLLSPFSPLPSLSLSRKVLSVPLIMVGMNLFDIYLSIPTNTFVISKVFFFFFFPLSHSSLLFFSFFLCLPSPKK